MGQRSTDRVPRETEAVLLVTLALTGSGVAGFLVQAPAVEVDPRLTGSFLWLFLALFMLRVVGQVVVRLRAPGWLPPMEQWNLVPYRFLLPIQIVLLVLMGWIAADLFRGTGVFARPSAAAGRAFVWFSYVYAGAMAVRYTVRMRRRPDQRWSGGAIPIVFHLVLAAFAFTLGIYHASY